MSKLLEFELITPEGILLKNEIKGLVATTDTGEVGILYNHANFKAKLGKAPVQYTLENGSQDLVAVLGGILEVSNNHVTILTDFAEKSADINETQAHKAAEEAKIKFQTLNPAASPTDAELLMAEVNLQKELLRLKTAQLRKQL